MPSAPPSRLARARRLAALLAVVVGCVAYDAASKAIASRLLVEGDRHSFLGDTVRLELAHNAGAFLSLGAGLPEAIRVRVLTWLVGAIVAGALWVAFRPASRTRVAYGAALVAAGGLGNLVDRIATHGWVVDFLNLGIGPLRTGIFNFADVVLLAGAAMIAWPERRARRDASSDTPPPGARSA
jgi:signal peptidase II